MRAALLVGVVLWLGGLTLLPAEIAAGKGRHRPTARTFGTIALFLTAAVLVLHGLPRRPDEDP